MVGIFILIHVVLNDFSISQERAQSSMGCIVTCKLGPLGLSSSVSIPKPPISPKSKQKWELERSDNIHIKIKIGKEIRRFM